MCERERERVIDSEEGEICPRPSPDFTSTQIAFFTFLKQNLNPIFYIKIESLIKDL